MGAPALTSAQIRAARALLDLTVQDLAHLAGVHRNTVIRVEADPTAPGHAAASIRLALEAAGVMFLPAGDGLGPGVRLRELPPTT